MTVSKQYHFILKIFYFNLVEVIANYASKEKIQWLHMPTSLTIAMRQLSEFILWKQLDFYFLFFTEADFESHSNFFLFCSISSISKNI